jgi:hypothetical protein
MLDHLWHWRHLSYETAASVSEAAYHIFGAKREADMPPMIAPRVPTYGCSVTDDLAGPHAARHPVEVVSIANESEYGLMCGLYSSD